MDNWISVADGLPKKSGSYLVVGKSGTVFITHFYTKDTYSGVPRFSNKYVTHWQEIPEFKHTKDRAGRYIPAEREINNAYRKHKEKNY